MELNGKVDVVALLMVHKNNHLLLFPRICYR